VTAKDIADALEQQKYNIDRKKVLLEDHIKQVGEYKVPVRVHREVTAEVTVNVVAEQ
jgi:large subunit ribosomal protein L9